MAQIQRTLQELYFTMEKQGAEIREMTRNMHDLGKILSNLYYLVVA